MTQKKNKNDVILKQHDEAGDIDRIKSEFIALASHQLRTPLSVVNWYTEMLLNGDAGKLTKEQKNYLKEIYNSNQLMIALVNSLLNISRLELGTLSIEPELTDIRGIVRAVLGDLSASIAKKNLTVIKRISSALSKIMVDRKLIRIIIQNLVKNAVKYTPDAGRIVLTANRDKQKMFFTVSDTGIGIPKSQQPRIFSKFFRADNAREADAEGSGLGLYIVKVIVQKAGGKVWYTSSEKHGTTFYVSFPIGGVKKSLLA